jgi:hypothetical protein
MIPVILPMFWVPTTKEEKKAWRKEQTLRRRYERYLTKLNVLTYDAWRLQNEGKR